MKVTITADMKKVITLSDMPAVNKVIAAMKEDSSTAKDYAEQAARIASSNNNVKVLEASAEIACNARIFNGIADGTAHYDVWIQFTAIIDNGFGGIIMGGAYITDLWKSIGIHDGVTCGRMYIRKFIETK